MVETIKSLMNEGITDQHKLFAILYPTYRGHYSRLRDVISSVKNDDANSTR